MIRSAFFILLFYFLGELLSLCTGHFIPGSVIGMILLFTALYFKVLKPEYVRTAATFITKNMALFFLPAGVGLMAYWELISANLTAILLAIAGSTILTMVTVAFVQERFEKKRSGASPSDNSDSDKND